jgi:tripartite-type tricarboxylate transporter receptor subunit TctC
MAEAGYPDTQGDQWVGVLAPAGTPKDIVALLNREIARALASPDIKERLAPQGYTAVASSPEEFATLVRADMDRWGEVIRAANLKPE